MTPKKKRLAIKLGNKEFALSFVFSISSSLMGMVFSFACAQLLESSLYGEIHYYLSIISLLSSILLFGSDSFLIKNIQFAEDRTVILSKIYSFVLLISTLVLPIYFFVGMNFLSRLGGNQTLIFTIFFIAVALSLATLAFAVLQGLNKYHIRTLVSSFIPHLAFLLIFFLHYAFNSLDCFADWYLLYYCLVYCTYGVFVFFKYFRFGKGFLNKNEFLSILFMGGTWVLYNVTGPISNIFIGEKFEDFGIVGIFSLSQQLMTIAGLATGIISSSANSSFAKIKKSDDADKLIAAYSKITRVNMYIGVPFYAAFIFEAKQIFAFFGPSYLGHNWILILLSVSSLVECVTGPCGSVLLMSGYEKQNFFASIVRFAVFVFGVSVMINFTELAAPISLICSGLASNIVKLVVLKKYEKRDYFSKSILITFLVIFITSGLVFFGLSFIQNSYLWLSANVICGLFIIFSCIVLTPFKDDKKYFTKGKD